MPAPTPPWRQHQAVNPALHFDEALGQLRSGMDTQNVNHHAFRRKFVVSAVVMIAAMDDWDVASVLAMAESETKEPLTSE